MCVPARARARACMCGGAGLCDLQHDTCRDKPLRQPARAQLSVWQSATGVLARFEDLFEGAISDLAWAAEGHALAAVALDGTLALVQFEVSPQHCCSASSAGSGPRYLGQPAMCSASWVA